MTQPVYRLIGEIDLEKEGRLVPHYLDVRIRPTQKDIFKLIDVLGASTNLNLWSDMEVRELTDAIDKDEITEDVFDQILSAIADGITENYRDIYGSDLNHLKPYAGFQHEVINDFMVQAQFTNSYPFVDKDQDVKIFPQILRQYPLNEYSVDTDEDYEDITQKIASYYDRVLENHHYAYSIMVGNDTIEIFFTPPFIEDLGESL